MGDDGTADSGYGGFLGAFPYGLRVAVTVSFRAYVVIAAVVTIVVSVIVAGGVIQLLATAGGSGGVTAFVRAFYIVIGVAIVVPVVTPVLVVARRHRTNASSSKRGERLLAGSGVAFILFVYLGLIASTPKANQRPVEGFLAPIATWLYGLPRIAGVVFPLLGAVIVYLGVRVTREAERR